MNANHRKAVERLYTDSCVVIEQKKTQRANKTTEFKPETVLENQPCKLSFTSPKNAYLVGAATTAVQNIVLFIAPEIEIKPGAEIIVSRHGKEYSYKSSGMPAVFDSHQEIMLEVVKKT